MSDDRDKELLEQPDGEAPSAETPPVIDSLEAAFAAIEVRDAEAAKNDQIGSGADTPGEVGAGDPAAPASGDTPAAGDAGVVPADDGGLLPGDGVGGDDDDGAASVSVEEARSTIIAQVEEQALLDVAQMFLDHADESGRKLIRQTDGKLGATINDPDIYRVDKATGVATFYNPDTGKPFTGDNPRAQAKQWVEGYNEDLRNEFNTRAEAYQQKLMEQQAPALQLIEFTPTYEKLDPVRQKMLDALLEDYEVVDKDGDHIGYSVDLNKALAQVNRQVELIQGSRPAAPPVEPTSPALDMPNSGSGTPGDMPDFKDVGEAMAYVQDRELAKGQKK